MLGAGVADDGMAPFVFGVDAEDALGDVGLGDGAFLARIGHSPNVVGQKLGAILELEGLTPLGLAELGATELVGTALRQLVAHSLEAAILALAAVLLALRLAALDMTGVKPSTGFELTSWS